MKHSLRKKVENLEKALSVKSKPKLVTASKSLLSRENPENFWRGVTIDDLKDDSFITKILAYLPLAYLTIEQNDISFKLDDFKEFKRNSFISSDDIKELNEINSLKSEEIPLLLKNNLRKEYAISTKFIIESCFKNLFKDNLTTSNIIVSDIIEGELTFLEESLNPNSFIIDFITTYETPHNSKRINETLSRSAACSTSIIRNHLKISFKIELVEKYKSFSFRNGLFINFDPVISYMDAKIETGNSLLSLLDYNTYNKLLENVKELVSKKNLIDDFFKTIILPKIFGRTLENNLVSIKLKSDFKKYPSLREYFEGATADENGHEGLLFDRSKRTVFPHKIFKNQSIHSILPFLGGDAFPLNYSNWIMININASYGHSTSKKTNRGVHNYRESSQQLSFNSPITSKTFKFNSNNSEYSFDRSISSIIDLNNLIKGGIVEKIKIPLYIDSGFIDYLSKLVLPEKLSEELIIWTKMLDDSVVEKNLNLSLFFLENVEFEELLKIDETGFFESLSLYEKFEKIIYDDELIVSDKEKYQREIKERFYPILKEIMMI